MLTLSALATLALMPQGSGSSTAPVVINEFMYDNWQDPDFREFVEIYNRSGGPVDISGWKLDAEDWQGALANNQDFVVPQGTIMQAGSYYVFGPEFGTVANTDQVCVLLPGSHTGLWENSDEGLALRDAQNNVVDVVYWEAYKKETGGFVPPAYLIEGQGIWGSVNSLNLWPCSWQRYRDGYDTNNNGRDFRMAPQTPGNSNNYPNLYPYQMNMAQTAGTILPEWGSSFDRAKLEDPGVATGNNPAVIPPSPAGSSTVMCLAPRASNGRNTPGLGGGLSHNMLNIAPAMNVVLEAWVYFDATPEATDPNDGSSEAYAWSLGIQGHSDGWYGFPDVHPTLGSPQNGDTGITLTYVKDNVGATLYLIDHNDGGLDHMVLGQIAIQAGVNDGWQRVRLQASANWAEARFGGSYGGDDGTVMSGEIEGHQGGVWVSQRVIRDPGFPQPVPSITQRPFTCDAFEVRTFDPGLTLLGQATPNSSTTPVIGAEGWPHQGNAAFQLTTSELLPSTNYTWLFDFPPFTGAPIDLSIIGAPAGATLWAVPGTSSTATSSVTGTGSLNVPITADPGIVGAMTRVQVFQIDNALTSLIPVSHTQGLELTFTSY